VPSPRPSAPPASSLRAGWFAAVPAYRLATFRVALAVTTLVFHVPKFNGLIHAYVSSAFHVPPTFAWLPTLTSTAGMALAVLQYVAAGGMLVGIWPRTSAWFLAGAGAYVMLLDPEHYSHNAHFHLTLLALAGCSSDGLSLPRLFREDDATARCPAWPERLVHLQVAILFFYAALDKVFSPSWGASGAILPALVVADHGLGLGVLQRANRAVLRAIPAILSVGTILTEGFLAVASILPSLRRAGLIVGFAFVVYLEFLVKPGVFTWDMLAAGLVFMPAGDRAWRVMYDPTCRACRRNRALLSPLDWLRRLRWVEVMPSVARPSPRVFAGVNGRGALHLVSPRDRAFCGLGALRALPAVLPGPLLVILVVARFGGGFLAARGYGQWDDLPFLVLGAYLASWLPELARSVVRARHPWRVTGCGHAQSPSILDPPRGGG
jgi:Vitamin K-dependent gamma-carboxylase